MPRPQDPFLGNNTDVGFLDPFSSGNAIPTLANGSKPVKPAVSLTQAQYDAIAVKDPAVQYLIVG